MSWREQLQPASFRGVEFSVASAGGTFGRRSVTHQFPFRDIPYVEDLGRRAREIRIEAIMVGADYMVQRDALIEACEQAGPGKLAHPYLGELTVSLTDAGLSIEESSVQGGMCRVTFVCIESGEARFPTAQAATQDIVKQRADEGLLASASAFADRFSLDNLSGWAGNLSLDQASGFLDTVRNAIAPLANIASGRGTIFGLLDRIAPSLGSLLSNGMSFVVEVQNLFHNVRTSLDPQTAAIALAVIGDFGVGETHLLATTPTRERAEVNRNAITELVRATACITRARAVADMTFDDYGQAVAVRDSVVAQIDLVAESTADDATFNTLSALRAAVVRDIAARGADLARVVTVTPQATLPALVLAHDLYQDASRDAEILAHNRIAHPGFVAAGTPIEVPADA